MGAQCRHHLETDGCSAQAEQTSHTVFPWGGEKLPTGCFPFLRKPELLFQCPPLSSKDKLNPLDPEENEPSYSKGSGFRAPSHLTAPAMEAIFLSSCHITRPQLTCLHITQSFALSPALPAPSTPPKSNTPTVQLNLIKIRKKFAFSFHCTPSNHKSSSNFENFVPLLIISLILHFKAQRQSISLVVY